MLARRRRSQSISPPHRAERQCIVRQTKLNMNRNNNDSPVFVESLEDLSDEIAESLINSKVWMKANIITTEMTAFAEPSC